LASTIPEQFKQNVPLVVRRDSKTLPSRDGAKSDRMQIVVSGMNVERLLGISVIGAGTEVEIGA